MLRDKPRTLQEFKNATAEYRRLANYLKVAIRLLPRAECELLQEFAEISKQKCQRLQSALDRRSSAQRSVA